MRSQTSITSAMLWSISSTPASWSSRTERTTAANSGTSASGSPAAGSSISTKDGSIASARATPRRRSSPWAKPPARTYWCAERLSSGRSSSARRRASRGAAPTPSAATSMFSRTERSRNDLECWNVRASPARPRRCGLQLVISRCPSSIEPEVGKSNPVMRFTSVDLPAPFGPIRPRTSFCRSSSVTSSSACTPSNERETERARRNPCGVGLSALSGRVARLRAVSAVGHGDDTRRTAQPGLAPIERSCLSVLDLRDDLRGDGADDLLRLALDADHAVLAAEHAVLVGREADEARERRHLLELHHLIGESLAVRRVARAGVGGDETVDRGGAGHEAAGTGLDGLGELVDGRVRVIAEGRGVGNGVIVRHAVLGEPVGAVSGPRVEDGRVVAERAQTRDECGELAERRHRDVDVGLLAVQPADRRLDVVGARRVGLVRDDLAAELLEA